MWSWQCVNPPIDTESLLVIETEICHPYELVLIDVLTDENGRLSPPTRNMADVTTCFSRMNLWRHGVRIRIRRYFESLSDVTAYAINLKYPIDEFVAIEDRGTTAKKLKPLRSVELRIGPDRKLYTEDGKVGVADLRLNRSMKTGEIIEPRFKMSRAKVQDV